MWTARWTSRAESGYWYGALYKITICVVEKISIFLLTPWSSNFGLWLGYCDISYYCSNPTQKSLSTIRPVTKFLNLLNQSSTSPPLKWESLHWLNSQSKEEMLSTHLWLGLHFHHLVSVYNALDESLYRPIELHKDHIGGIGKQQADTFPVRDVVIQEENY